MPVTFRKITKENDIHRYLIPSIGAVTNAFGAVVQWLLRIAVLKAKFRIVTSLQRCAYSLTLSERRQSSKRQIDR